jgi:hypothetical protein
MRSGPDDRFRQFRTSQTIKLRHAKFKWRACSGPFGFVKVTDAFAGGQGDLQVKMLGLFPRARVHGGGQVAKGEVMRYLAELPWAPDALVANRMLVWRLLDDRGFAVSAGTGNARGEITLTLGADGVIASISALRPREESGETVERPWHGRFSDYRWHGGRLIPFRGEVGWIVDEREFVVWRGEITKWCMR